MGRAEQLFGKDISNVPRPELLSSTWPEPSSNPPFQAVRAERVGMGDSLASGAGACEIDATVVVAGRKPIRSLGRHSSVRSLNHESVT